jgi:hypothetical protein
MDESFTSQTNNHFYLFHIMRNVLILCVMILFAIAAFADPTAPATETGKTLRVMSISWNPKRSSIVYNSNWLNNLWPVDHIYIPSHKLNG